MEEGTAVRGNTQGFYLKILLFQESGFTVKQNWHPFAPFSIKSMDGRVAMYRLAVH